VTRSLSRIRASAALALALAAVAAPTALADTPVGSDQLSIQAAAVDRVTPDARDAATAPVFWSTPGASPSAVGATPAAQTPTRPVASSGDADWVVAAIIVLFALFAAGTMTAVRLRRRSIPVA
jgi:hypothetical protein